MSNALQQTLPANAPAAFGSSNSEGVITGPDSPAKSQYKWGMSGSTNGATKNSSPVRTAKARMFDKPENRGSAIGVNTSEAKMPKSRP